MRIDLAIDEAMTILAALNYYYGNGQGEPDNREEGIHLDATGESIGCEVISLDDVAIAKLYNKIKATARKAAAQ